MSPSFNRSVSRSVSVNETIMFAWEWTWTSTTLAFGGGGAHLTGEPFKHQRAAYKNDDYD